MIRIFNHYVHRQTLLQVSSDCALLVLMLVAVFFVPFGHAPELLSVAGPHVLSLAAGMVVISAATGIYQRGPNLTPVQTCARAVAMLVIALPLAWLTFGLLPAAMPDRHVVQVAAMAGVAAVVARRVYVTHWGARDHDRMRVLIFGTGTAAQIVGQTLIASDPNVEIVGFVPGPNEKEAAVPAEQILHCEHSLTTTAKELDVDEIVVALTERRAGSMPLRQLLDCKLFGVKVYDLSTHFEKRLGQIRIDFVNAGWLVFGEGFNQGALRTAIKRLSDIVFSLLLIVLAAPIMLLATLAIKLDSRGPVFYRQERVGLGGTSFMVTKFRSMRTDAEKDGKPRWATAQDDRVTRVGHIIRLLRIDELPQLFNVLKGQMSLVGPRPERPFFVEQLTREIPFFAVRHSVKPGVTGWAQVRYQYGSTVEDSQQKLQYDLYYVKNHSLFLDLVVLFETVGVVLTGKGAR
ncbi:sugar transferase [Rubrivivax gelatinosus]|uniref:Sugar transferase n=1 Tax=Rubrivivax gelatinosus TaxID=28068 RepID=A0ABS1DW80_RUBGE|nr:TIGR03013 family XrtA/PEP-CTERM system glycosyltransferase [Rubrivivax gelatinosus]MBK1612241.1 sugar transferase [Rubrivivax gelatinosus]MBK1714307.1 sugar transferase [Rubrivivax gelatinosus]